MSLPAPFEAYEGHEPYVFVCYAHEDREQVHSDIEFLRRSRRIAIKTAFDLHVEPTTMFLMRLQKYIATCSLFVVYLSDAAFESEWVDRQVDLARELQKRILPIVLRHSQVPWTTRLAPLSPSLGIHRDELSFVDYRASLLQTLDRYLFDSATEERGIGVSHVPAAEAVSPKLPIGLHRVCFLGHVTPRDRTRYGLRHRRLGASRRAT
jgi:hypothetical protein